MRYEFHPEALEEYDEAGYYYAAREPGLDLRFIVCVEEATWAHARACCEWNQTKTMNVLFTPEKLRQLRHLQQGRKFAEEDFYPGAPTEDIRVECERRVNDFLDRVISLLQRGAPKEALLAQAAEAEAAFHNDDTEEHDKVTDYIGETMRIIGVEYCDTHDREDPGERDRYFGFKSK